MIAIVVLTHNRVHLLRRCVENVLARTSGHTTEIVIWNNGSTDGTREYLDGLTDPRLRVVHHERNIGQNAYAEAFLLTRAPYLVELDDDMIDAPDEWDRRLLEAFERLPRIGFLAANLVDNPHDQAARVMYRERPELYVPVDEYGVGLLKGPVGGGCALTTRELHDRVGGFRQDSKRVFWLEDEAYIADIEKLGYEAAYLRDLKLLHAGGSYYAPESEAKHQYWADYWASRARKDRVKRVLLRIPLMPAINDRFELFAPPNASPPAQELASD
jgi:GT2 family glycosyltransferase